MMDKPQLEEARDVLDRYIRTMHLRHTPERDAVLQAAFGFEGHFSVDMLEAALRQQHFAVSRATIYNTLRLLLKLNLVVSHRLRRDTTYEAANRSGGHCHQVCTLCGKMTEVKLPAVEQAMKTATLRRFRKEGYVLYIYGICSSCAAKIARTQRRDGRQAGGRGTQGDAPTATAPADGIGREDDK